MTSTTMTPSFALVPSLATAWQDVGRSFERFCLTAGIEAVEQMLREDAQELAGKPHSRGGERVGQRWGRTKGKIGFHGGKVTVGRPRVRSYDGHELALPTWTAAQAEDWLGRHEPHADQRLDAQAEACCATTGGGSASARRGRHLEVGGLPAGCGACGRPAGPEHGTVP